MGRLRGTDLWTLTFRCGLVRPNFAELVACAGSTGRACCCSALSCWARRRAPSRSRGVNPRTAQTCDTGARPRVVTCSFAWLRLAGLVGVNETLGKVATQLKDAECRPGAVDVR